MSNKVRTSAQQQQTQNPKKKRSRLGCKNCKLRGIKCDESQPECNRCHQYGVVCSYLKSSTIKNHNTTGDDLQFAVEHEIQLDSNSDESGIEEDAFTKALSFELLRVPTYKTISYWPTRVDELLNRFQLSTAGTISVGPRTQIYCTTIVDRARSYPFMMQMLLALTSMHMRSLKFGLGSDPSTEEARYSYNAIAMFAREVAAPRNAEHQAMLLCAASMIYNLTFANIEAKRPEDAWPMAAPSSTDLGWLKVASAKTEIRQLAQPMGQDPLFTLLASSFGPEIEARMKAMPCVALPLGFTSYFDLESSSRRNNPYLIPINKLNRILHTQEIITVTLAFIFFVAEMTDEFKGMIEKKDSRALLILVCWFGKIAHLPVWWYRQRAIIEGQAICLYLERYHADDLNLQVLLRFPKGLFLQLPAKDIYL